MSGADPPLDETVGAPKFSPDDPLTVLDSPTAGAKVIRGGVMRIGTYAGGVTIGILSAALMTRYLGVEDFGRYVIVTSLVTIVSGLTEAGIPNIAAREFATQDRSDRDALFANVLGIRLAIAVVGVAAAMVFAFLAGYDHTMIVGTLLAGVGLMIATVQQTYAIPIGVSLRFGWLSVLDLLRQAAFVAIVVVLVVTGADLLAFFGATIPPSLLLLVLIVPLVRGTAPLLPRLEWSRWLGIMRMVGVYAAAAAVGTIYVSAVVVTTSIVGTAQESGYLGAAFRVYTVLATVPLLLVSSAFPVLARAAHTDHERLQYAVQRLVDVSLIVGTWLALSTILGADVAIRIVAGEEFAPAVPVLQIQGAALFVSFLAITGAFALVSLHRHLVLLAGNLAGLTVIVALTAILVPQYGAKGAAVATLAAESGIVLLYGLTLFGRRFVHYKLELVPRIAAAGLLTAALALTPLQGIPLVIVATVVYWAALILLRGLPHEVIDALLRREPRTKP